MKFLEKCSQKTSLSAESYMYVTLRLCILFWIDEKNRFDRQQNKYPIFTNLKKIFYPSLLLDLCEQRANSHLLNLSHRVSIERKFPYMKNLKGEGNFPSYFDNNDVTYK